ncbi:hypothetical protein EHI8A_025460 [Entamoeba histolytica HM-1:IMSS-B]|uniref:Uncharacterized protein n=6 Tax=Entamoeba histolytica TaxID=5759 RepID=C4M027_ENTH1|nr:hypothetical protein, conserved [Entamoeba histolytica HM-1:IMSS]EMD47960.1 Hypothetical protein EHI5A_015690 [Entamoeba histolytica KU27]EMH78186.1 hypothetical protein EHI8A_025460 [Entamoeba histolytica HM-1:IMSS-B]EMS14380.1 hypothetical protein KM1_017010 [Entamoeba histolytica HM-3:IMSS]ENY62709.1 hypothetical protein EHI7A_008680 [Entamoeba histolytica HM-1:IMSS-A]GAT94495.1 hypothetical protein conserved [Entamoeba histolytica]|eukprot:XP_652128.1 hypothetical protein, conserved [Entamoeba histolytica HM-1:IMSS]
MQNYFSSDFPFDSSLSGNSQSNNFFSQQHQEFNDFSSNEFSSQSSNNFPVTFQNDFSQFSTFDPQVNQQSTQQNVLSKGPAKFKFEPPPSTTKRGCADIKPPMTNPSSLNPASQQQIQVQPPSSEKQTTEDVPQPIQPQVKKQSANDHYNLLREIAAETLTSNNLVQTESLAQHTEQPFEFNNQQQSFEFNNQQQSFEFNNQQQLNVFSNDFSFDQQTGQPSQETMEYQVVEQQLKSQKSEEPKVEITPQVTQPLKPTKFIPPPKTLSPSEGETKTQVPVEQKTNDNTQFAFSSFENAFSGDFSFDTPIGSHKEEIQFEQKPIESDAPVMAQEEKKEVIPENKSFDMMNFNEDEKREELNQAKQKKEELLEEKSRLEKEVQESSQDIKEIDNIKELQSENEQLQREINEMKKQIQNIKEEKSKRDEETTRLIKENNEMKKQINDLKQKLRDMKEKEEVEKKDNETKKQENTELKEYSNEGQRLVQVKAMGGIVEDQEIDSFISHEIKSEEEIDNRTNGMIEEKKQSEENPSQEIIDQIKQMLSDGSYKLGPFLSTLFTVQDEDFEDDRNEFPMLPFALL